MMRYGYLIGTNIAIMVVISVVLNIFNAHTYLNEYGINYTTLLIYSAIIGFMGSFGSLLMSKWLVKRVYRLHIIQEPANDDQQWLVNVVRRCCEKSNLPIPEIAVYESTEVNAFATGSSKKNALVAFSVGLLETMTQDETEGVVAHEIAHIANGDMVTMALIQGVVNTFVIFLSRIAALIVSNFLQGNRGNRGGFSYFSYFIISMIFQVLFGFLANIIVMRFSRQREYRADATSALLVGKHKMIAGLEKLKQVHTKVDKKAPELQTMKISNTASNLSTLLSTHPPLQERINRLILLQIP